MTEDRDGLPIGVVAARAGVSVPTLRFYEQRGLIRSMRSAGNQRRYPRMVLRRLAVIAAARRVGLSLDQVGETLAALPADRAPTQQEWTAISRTWATLVGQRLAELHRLKDGLDNCIGCGCLSLARCSLFNPGDEAAGEGSGARWVHGRTPPAAT
ncbi:MAG: redox-sensitive transcriptional activator SoxR [Actinomycetes bacterium]